MMRRRIWLIIVTVLVFAVGYLFWWLYRLPFVELAKELQAIKMAGEPTHYEEIVPPIPPSLNAASVYQQAFNALPKFSESEQRAFDDFRFGRSTDIRQVRSIIQRCQKVLELAKQASQFPHVRWVNVVQPYPYATQFPHTSPLRSLIRLLEAEALLHVREGNLDKALENCIVLLKIVRHLDEEPYSLHVMHIKFILRTTINIVKQICENKDISPKWAHRLMGLLLDWDGDRTLIRMLQLERVIHIQSFDFLRSSPRDAREFSLIWSEGCVIYTGRNIAGWIQPLSRQLAINELIVLRFDQWLLKIARKGEPYEWGAFKKLDEFAQQVKTTGIAFRYPSWLRGFAFRPLAMAGEVMWPAGLRVERYLPETAYSFEQIAEVKTHQRLLQTALALCLYRHEFDSYPKTLSELVPKFLPEVPKDPFDGKPLRYRCEGQGFKVWSVGSNLKDENGAPRKWLDGDICLSIRF